MLLICTYVGLGKSASDTHTCTEEGFVSLFEQLSVVEVIFFFLKDMISLID